LETIGTGNAEDATAFSRKFFGKIWAKRLRFWQIWVDLGKIKISHPQKH